MNRGHVESESPSPSSFVRILSKSWSSHTQKHLYRVLDSRNRVWSLERRFFAPYPLSIHCPQSADKERKKKREREREENISRILRSFFRNAYVMPMDKRRKKASVLTHRACIVRPHYWMCRIHVWAGNKKQRSVPALFEGGGTCQWCVYVCTRHGTRSEGREMGVVIPMGESRHGVSAESRGRAAAPYFLFRTVWESSMWQ